MRQGSSPSSAREALIQPLKLVTYNLHKGMSPLNRRVRLHEMLLALQHLDADLLFLQEVQGHHMRRAARFSDYPPEAHHHFLAHRLRRRAAYGLNASHRYGHHGNAILSRFPIRLCCNLDLSVNRFEQRGVLRCDIQLPGWPMVVTALCVHLNLLALDRKRQMAVLERYIDEHVPHEHSLILAGDFNDWRGEAHELFAERMNLLDAHHTVHGELARSFPARLPLLPLDRIYVRGLIISEARVLHGLPWRRLSDHLPISATLLPRGAK